MSEENRTRNSWKYIFRCTPICATAIVLTLAACMFFEFKEMNQFQMDSFASLKYEAFAPSISDAELRQRVDLHFDFLEKHYAAGFNWLMFWLGVMTLLVACLGFFVPFVGYRWFANQEIEIKEKLKEIEEFHQLVEKAKEQSEKSAKEAALDNKITIAGRLVRDKKYEEGEISLLKILKSEFPLKKYQESYIYRQLGDACFELKKYYESIDWYKKALGFNSKDSSILFNIGMTFARLRNYELAIRYFKRSITDREFNPNRIRALLDTYIDSKNPKYTKLIELLINDIIVNSPDSEELFNSAGNYYMNIGNFTKAEELYNKALLKSGNFKELVYSNLAFIYNMTERPKEAIIYLKKSIELRPETASNYLNLAFSFILLKKFSSALEFAKTYLKKEERNDISFSNSSSLKEAFAKAKVILESTDDANAKEVLELLPKCNEKYQKNVR